MMWGGGKSNSCGRRRIHLIEHWDGADWDVVPSPNAGNLSSLSSVATISGSDVWAVGCAFCGDAGIGQAPLIEHWNGTRWTISPAPSSGLGSDGNSVLAFPSGSVFVGGFAGSLVVGSNRSSCIPPRDASVLARTTLTIPSLSWGEGGWQSRSWWGAGERVGKGHDC